MYTYQYISCVNVMWWLSHIYESICVCVLWLYIIPINICMYTSIYIIPLAYLYVFLCWHLASDLMWLRRGDLMWCILVNLKCPNANTNDTKQNKQTNMVMQAKINSTLSMYLSSSSLKLYVCILHCICQEHVYVPLMSDKYSTYNIYSI